MIDTTWFETLAAGLSVLGKIGFVLFALFGVYLMYLAYILFEMRNSIKKGTKKDAVVLGAAYSFIAGLELVITYVSKLLSG